MSRSSYRLATGLFAFMALATTGVLAQGVPASQSPLAAPQPVGTLTIATIGETPTPVYSFAFEATQSGGFGGGGGAGQATISDIAVSRVPDSISPLLFRSVVLGQQLANARVDIYVPGTTNVQSSYRLTNVLITGVSSSDAAESIKLAFAQVEIVAGGTTTCFDIVTNASC